jgi:signal transduction histidine kinase
VSKVSNKTSLQYQFKKQLAFSIGLLVIVFFFLLYKLFFIGIGTTMHRNMISMASHYAKQVELNADYQLPSADEYSVYLGQDNMPSEIKMLFDVDELADFELAVNDGDQLTKLFRPEKVYFLLAYPIAYSNNKLYLLYHDVRRQNTTAPTTQGPILNIPISIALITLFAISLVYWVARGLINKVLNPLNELAVMAKSLDENKPELSFAVMEDSTEIGVVANTLHQTMGRIHQYHQREKQFLQNASHELRTPIAVVSSALDIIDLRTAQGNPKIIDQHINIRRANKNMAEVTEALLLLSRKNVAQTNRQIVDLEQLVATIIDEHRYLLKGKNIDVEYIVDECSSYELPLSLCRITLSNLIRNAFEHTLSGIVGVQLNKRTIAISNTGAGLTHDSQMIAERGISQGQGFGIGLDIVKKIVEQQRWTLQFLSNVNNDSQVVICFEQTIDENCDSNT